MKTKLLLLAICLGLLTCLPGCQLALEDNGAVQEDRLIGMFISTKDLDMADSGFYPIDSSSISPDGSMVIRGDTQQFKSRIYATLQTETTTSDATGAAYEYEQYVFNDVEGYYFFCPNILDENGEVEVYSNSCSPDISDFTMKVSLLEEEDRLDMEATLYLTPAALGQRFICNQVYQSADGSVYLTSGSSMGSSPVDYEGNVMSMMRDQTTTLTENGQSKQNSTSVKLNISCMFAPQLIVVLQMDADSNILDRQEYAPDGIPEWLPTEKDTAYIVVETHKRPDNIGREVYSRGAEYIETFSAQADGVCIKHQTDIKW